MGESQRLIMPSLRPITLCLRLSLGRTRLGLRRLRLILGRLRPKLMCLCPGLRRSLFGLGRMRLRLGRTRPILLHLRLKWSYEQNNHLLVGYPNKALTLL